MMTKPIDRPSAFALRGEFLMLASDVASAFGVDTRLVVQNIKKNPIKMPTRYAFELTEAEVDSLRSLGVISKPGRGGSRALPWVLTQKGVIRLATIMDSPKALEATDMIVDVFSEVIAQLAQGSQAVTVSHPSRLLASEQTAAPLQDLRRQVVKAIDNLLNITIDPKSGITVREELGDVATTAISHLKELMRGKKVSNERIEAEALLIVEQTRDIFERRQAHLADAALDRERKALENVEMKLVIVERLLGMIDRLEPNAVVRLLPAFIQPIGRLPPPEAD